MQVKKEMGGWLKPDETRTGALLTILDATEVEKKDFKGNPKKVVQLSVRTEDDTVTKVDLNGTSKNNAIDAYGGETNDWIGKTLRVEIVNQKVGNEFKDVLYLTHPSTNLKGDIIT